MTTQSISKYQLAEHHTDAYAAIQQLPLPLECPHKFYISNNDLCCDVGLGDTFIWDEEAAEWADIRLF